MVVNTCILSNLDSTINILFTCFLTYLHIYVIIYYFICLSMCFTHFCLKTSWCKQSFLFVSFLM